MRELLVAAVALLSGCAEEVRWPPSATIEVVAAASDRVSFSWPPADGASAYVVRVDGADVARLGADARSYEALELAEASEHRFEVEAIDADGRSSSVLTLAASTSDGTAPSFPEGAELTVRAEPSEADATSSDAVLEWPAATDNVAVVRYRVLRGEEDVGALEPPETTLRLAGIEDGARYTVRALDAQGNESDALEAVWHAPPAAQEPAPQQPDQAARNDARIAVEAAQAQVEQMLLGALGPPGVTGGDVLRAGAATGSSEDLLAQAEGVGVASGSDSGQLRSSGGGGELRSGGLGGIGSLRATGGGLHEDAARQRGRATLGELRATTGPPYDATALERFLRMRRLAMQRCYERELARDPSLAGTVDVTFTVTPTGTVESAAATRSFAATVDPCVLRVLRTIRVPEAPTAPVTFATSVTFAPSE